MRPADRPLRVLMVDSERSWRGGQEQVRLLMSGLVETGLDVSLAAPSDGELFARAASLNIRRIAWNPSSPVVSVLEMRKILAAGKFDIVHSHASRAHGAVALARLGRAGRVVHVVSRRVDFSVGGNPGSAWKYRHGADAYIAISEGVCAVLIAGGVPAARIRIVPSGIDLGKFAGRRDPREVRRELGIGEGTRIVGNIAALAPHKSHADLLDAAAIVLKRHERVRFLIVGDGELRADLDARARRLGIDRDVTFTGFRTDALDLLGIFDCFVMSSYLEGLGTSIMDAQAAGIPVVATRTGGIPEIVKDGETGLLVPPRDPSRLAGAIVRMLDDRKLREACVRAARRQAEGYDYHNTVYKTLDVYRRLCQKEHFPPEGQ